jgi:TolB-like protein/class 3 adenylate cyclase
MGTERPQRHLAAILAADVVGYSRLMEQDEAGTFERLSSYRKEVFEPEIANHQGRIFKLMGDGLLAEFGSVVDAVECAIVLQRAMSERNAGIATDRRIDVRIGINLGDVILEGDDRYGDGVNIAARLEGLAEPGGVLISGSAYEQVKKKLALDCDFLGEQRVKNISDPVRVYRVCAGRDTAHGPRNMTWWRRWPPMISILLVFISAGIVSYRYFVVSPQAPKSITPSSNVAAPSTASLPLPDKPSIAVLPFVNMSADPADESFTDGLTEDVITELSRLQDMFVIARDSTFVFKNRSVDVQQVGRQFGVRYVLEGSVQRSAKQMRVNAQLIDAITGRHIWAERYDRAIENLFAVQEDLTTNIVGVLLSKVRAAEVAAAFRKPTTELRAYDLVKQSIRYRNTFTKEANLHGREVLIKAIELDPSYAEAYAWLGKIYGVDFAYQLTGPARQESLDHALELIEKAIALKPDLAVAYAFLNFALFYDGRVEEALVAGRKSVELAPNDTECLIQLARVEMINGLYAEALATAEKAMRLNPSPPEYYFWIYGQVLYATGHYDKALDALRTQVAMNPAIMFVHLNVAITLVRLGRIDEARSEIAFLRHAFPQFSIENARRRIPLRDTTMMHQYTSDLRTAGLPEGP